ncbi:MAG: peptide deformylase [Elusimicrobia bacterium]|nr:peptide deformylase [Elusimicrobiota bacterium]
MGVPIRKVVRLGHPVLRAPARHLTPKEIAAPEVQRLIEEMAASMVEYEGVGIAAPQVGEGVSLFLMGLAEGSPRHKQGIPLTVVFNPVVEFVGRETALDYEGCLSAPGLRGQVERAKALELSGLDHKGKAFTKSYEGFPARVVQHETDHLNGLVYLDRMKGLKTLGYID